MKFDVAKLDAEGYEMGVLRGMEKVLADTRIHFLVMEYHPAMLATTGTDPEGILHFLAHYGFQCYSLKLPSMNPVTFQEFTSWYLEPSRLKLKGMGELEDLFCENVYFTPAKF